MNFSKNVGKKQLKTEEKRGRVLSKGDCRLSLSAHLRDRVKKGLAEGSLVRKHSEQKTKEGVKSREAGKNH